MLGYDTLLSQVFLLAWIAVFYGLMYLFNRFVPKGFIILQIASVYIWGLLPFYDVYSLGFLSYDNIPVYWVVAALIFIFVDKKE